MSSDSEYTRNLKLILLCLILVFAITGVLSPRLFNPFGNKIVYANLVSAGVLFSGGIVHLLGEAVISVNQALPGDDYPWGYLFCGLSFYFIFCSERLIIHGIMNKQRHKHSHHHSFYESDKDHVNCHNYSHSHYIDKITPAVAENKSSDCCSTSNAKVEQKTTTLEERGAMEIQGVSVKSIVYDSSTAAIDGIEEVCEVCECNECECEEDAGHHHGTDVVTLLDKQNFRAAFILLFGLGMHSILAGFALGASQDSSTVFSLGIAIVAHKYLEAFALGCPLYKSNLPLRTSVGVAVFYALLTPFGMAVGWIAGQEFDNFVSDIFVCITAGTFIYVSICEIMIPEFSHDHSLLTHEKEDTFFHESCKMMAVLFGYGLMSMLAIWV